MTHDGWVAGVKFKTHDVNNLHNELGHSSENITHVSGKAVGLKVIGMF